MSPPSLAPDSFATSDFDFILPPELVATHPHPERVGARLLVLHRETARWEHRRVADICDYVLPGDLWLMNNSRVLRARLHSHDGAVELLLLEETSPRHWLCLARPAKKTKAGMILRFPPRRGEGLPEITAEILRTLDTGERVVRFHQAFDPEFYGEVPLPPYIENRRKTLGHPVVTEEDARVYQTVFAADAGSVAAPTAGLHFTPDLLARLPHAFVTLHVGVGTFRPVKTELLADHKMLEERYTVSEATAAAMKAAQRIVSVGTTTARVLETLRKPHAATGRTDIFITPPHSFKMVQALMTNFHLPRSTLLMLVAAFVADHPAWRDRPREALEFLLSAYREAIAEGYRFYSYGDAMFIL
jgi:S-adenosylmethionine:tRNA ribosyltransferase-isomerase